MELLSVFTDIADWVKGAGLALVLGAIVTVLRKKGVILNVKRFFGYMEKVTEKVGMALIETSDVFGEANKSISKDGKLKENSIKDVLREGKEAVIEWQDAVMVIKPKKKAITDSKK